MGPRLLKSDNPGDEIGGALVIAAPRAVIGPRREVGNVAETFLYLMRNGYSGGTIVTVGGGSVLA